MANQNTLADLSSTPASNLNIKGQSQQGTAPASTIDNIFQRYGAALHDFYNSLGGVAIVSGTNTLTVTITEDWAAYASGLILAIKTPNSNTGAVTLNVTVPTAGALGAKAIRRQGDSALQANDMVANGVYLLRYSSTYNSSAGAWILLNPAASPSITAGSGITISGSTVTLGGSGVTLRTFFPRDNEPPSSNYATFGTRNGHSYLAFPDAVTYAAIFTGILPSYYQGGGLTLEIEWMGSGTSTNKVCFGAYIEYVDVGTTDFDSDSFASEQIDTTGVAGNATSGIISKTTITFSSGANMDSLVAGATFRLKIVRETGQTNDTNTGDAQVVAVRVKET